MASGQSSRSAVATAGWCKAARIGILRRQFVLKFPISLEGGYVHFLARTRSQQAGRACPLCPGTSDVNLLRYRERVIDLNAQISDGALDLCVAEQELDGPKIAGAPIDQRRLRSSEGMGAEKLGFKSEFRQSIQRQAARIGVSSCSGPCRGGS